MGAVLNALYLDISRAVMQVVVGPDRIPLVSISIGLDCECYRKVSYLANKRSHSQWSANNDQLLQTLVLK